MPKPISGSPDITVLDFAVLYDISGPISAITLTNQSVGNPSGTTGLNLCTWWYVITTPSGAIIHQGSATAPDVTAANWNTLSITPNSWPTPFGTPPCGQVEFSCAVPYVCTLFVKDATNTVYSYAKNTVICRPGRSNNNTCGSFGGADVLVTIQCQNGKIYAQDTTDYTYQSKLGTQETSTWTLRYPADASGIPPANETVTNAPYVYFDLGYSGEGYTLYLQTYATYDLGNGCSVKIQYKLFGDSGIGTGKSFPVWCNVDMCKLDCEMQKFYELVKTSCGEVENPELKNKAIQINLLYNRLLTGILQPLCNIDVPGIIKQIEKLGGFSCDCCCGGGINIGNPVPPPNGNGGCCPITTPVNIVGTTNPPAECPGSYFPRQIYDPTGTSVIGTANSADDMISILNGNSAWAAYGVAFNQGNCQVGWYPNSQGETIPSIKVQGATVETTCQGNTQNYTVEMQDVCYPANTPITAASFPINLWIDYGLGAGIEYVGNFASQAAAVAGLNAMSDKPATLTFSAGGSVSTVNIFNSSCADYNGVISLTADVGSANFLLYGGNHTSLIGSTASENGEYAVAMRLDIGLGKIVGNDPTKHLFHNIRLGNYLISGESDTGKIYFWNITNPLMPTLTRTIQLNDVTGTSFTGLPLSTPIEGYPTLTSSWFSLYFPTDYLGTMNENDFIVMEGITGTIWKLNLSDPSTGVVASFADQRLRGKCPRVVVARSGGKPMLYFTEDGNLEASAGLSSGVTDGSIVKLDLSVFSAGGLSVQSIYTGSNYAKVLAASYDGSNTIYFTTKDSSVVSYNVATQSVASTATNAMGSVFLNWVNSTYFNGKLYVASLFNYATPQMYIVDVLSLITPPISVTPMAIFNYLPMNIRPLGNCLMVVTANKPASGTFAEGGALLLYKTDGAFLGYIVGSSAAGVEHKSYYNIIPFAGVGVYYPNSFV